MVLVISHKGFLEDLLSRITFNEMYILSGTMEISLKTFSVILGVVYILYMYVWNI